MLEFECVTVGDHQGGTQTQGLGTAALHHFDTSLSPRSFIAFILSCIPVCCLHQRLSPFLALPMLSINSNFMLDMFGQNFTIHAIWIIQHSSSPNLIASRDAGGCFSHQQQAWLWAVSIHLSGCGNYSAISPNWSQLDSGGWWGPLTSVWPGTRWPVVPMVPAPLLLITHQEAANSNNNNCRGEEASGAV